MWRKCVHSALHEAVSSQVICRPSHPAALNELFTKHLLTAEEFSEVVRKAKWEWEDHFALVLSIKPAEVVQEACQVLEKHGCHVKTLKSELYYSSTLCQIVFQILLHYANSIVAHAPTAFVHTHTCADHRHTHYVNIRGINAFWARVSTHIIDLWF